MHEFIQWGLKEGKLAKAVDTLLGNPLGKDRFKDGEMMLNDILRHYKAMPKGVTHGRWGLVPAISILMSNGYLDKNDRWDSLISSLMREEMFLDYGAVPLKLSSEDDFITEGILCISAYHSLSDRLKKLGILERMIALVDEFEYLLTADLTSLTGNRHLTPRQLHSMAYFLIHMRHLEIYPVKTATIISLFLDYCRDLTCDKTPDNIILDSMAAILRKYQKNSCDSFKKVLENSAITSHPDACFFKKLYNIMPDNGLFSNKSGYNSKSPTAVYLNDPNRVYTHELILDMDKSMKNKKLEEQFSFIMTIRIDSVERLRNFKSCISFFMQHTDARFIITEADSRQKANMFEGSKRVDYKFVKDENVIFHRTHYINNMLRKCRTKYAGIWDIDAICEPSALINCIEGLKQTGATMVYPYNGRFWGISDFFATAFSKNLDITTLSEKPQSRFLIAGYHAVGGAFVVDVEKYRVMGWENEHFKGWGPEDMERYRRLEICGRRPIRINSELYHLNHPRGINSSSSDPDLALSTKEEYVKVCSMDCKELLNYIKGWKWTK